MSEKSLGPASRPTSPSHAALALGALGIVFGDLGTSPLYALQECFTGPHGVAPNPGNVLGVLSLVFWSLTLVVTVKYLTFLMRADNRGEGGILVLLALAPDALRTCRPGHLRLITALAIAGAALLFGDGILTPAVSVLSAVEGLAVAEARLAPVVVPLSVAILLGLFAVQSRGTGKLGALFGPVMLLWFGTAGVLGGWHLVRAPSVLRALSPHYAVAFFVEHGWHGLRTLGGVVLVVTGCEALYADMGHFGRKPIRTAWLAVCLPSLVLCYFGQGAMVLANPATAARPFYALCPNGPWIYPLIALASVATVIASQALISGVFSLTHQAVRLNLFPRVTVRHTSGDVEGQIYLPLLNMGLAVACVVLVLTFQESAKLASAYGLAVSGTMLLTSLLFYPVVRRGWRWPAWKVWPLLALFLSVDVPFVIANGLKFFEGGYVPFLVGAAFALVMATWHRGRSLLAERVAQRAMPIETFLATLPDRLDGRLRGAAVMMASLSSGTPPVLSLLTERFRMVHETVLLLTVLTEPVPIVPEGQRLDVLPLGEGFYRVLVRRGFMENPQVPSLLDEAFTRAGLAPPHDVVYLLGRETVMPSSGGRMGVFFETVFAFLSRNARNATDYFGLPPEQVVEVGTQVDL